MQMKFIHTASILLLLAPTILLSTVSANNSGKWFLMSRHGECVEISSLQRKIPDIGNIQDPQSFIKFMAEKGHEVAANELTELHGKALQVNIPEKGLSLIFAKGSICKEFISK